MPKRCGWVKMNNPLYVAYHDEEWGRPLHDDQALFELLCMDCLLYTSPSPRDMRRSRMPSSA